MKYPTKLGITALVSLLVIALLGIYLNQSLKIIAYLWIATVVFFAIVDTKYFKEWYKQNEARKSYERVTEREERDTLEWERKLSQAREIGRHEANRAYKEKEYRRKQHEKIVKKGVFGGTFRIPKKDRF
mgnify:CR=1 FL=1